MGLRTRYAAMAVAIEDVPGVQKTLTANDAKLLVYEPSFELDQPMFERDPARGSLSPLQGIPGIRTGRFRGRVELRGSGAAGTQPVWSRILRASGFRELEIRSNNIGAITGGPFLRGEKITTAGGFEGFVMDDTANGAASILYSRSKGTLGTATLITGATSGATATTSSVASAVSGYEYRPVSEPKATIAIGAITGGPYQAGELVVGTTSGAIGRVTEATANGAATLPYRPIAGVFANAETITGQTSGATCSSTATPAQQDVLTVSAALWEDVVRHDLKGAVCNGTFRMNVGEPGFYEFEMMGVWVSTTDSPMPSISHETTVPPKFQGATFQVDAKVMNIATLEVGLGNTIATETDPNQASGINQMELTGRKPTLTIDPQAKAVSDYDFMGKFSNGTTIKMFCAIGSTAGNKVRFYVPAAQFASIGKGDREGLRTHQVNANVVSPSGLTGDDELTLALQ